MNRKEAIQAIVKEIGTSPIVSANGYISRDLYETHDRKENFYMIGSMGLASSIALGVAIKNPKIKVYVFDGDGNILMNLGSLATIGNLKPKNLIHVVFDNSNGKTVTMRKEAYFKQASIDTKEKGAYVEYDKEKTMVNMLKYKHWGPWELNSSLVEEIPDDKKEIGKKKLRISPKILQTIKDKTNGQV